MNRILTIASCINRKLDIERYLCVDYGVY